MDQKKIKLIAAGAIFLLAFVVILYNLGAFSFRGPGSEGHIEVTPPAVVEQTPEATTEPGPVGGARLAPD